MKEWHSAKELAGTTGIPGTKSGVVRKARNEHWTFRDVPAPGGPGGKRREYHISSLPEATRIALLEAEAGIVAMDAETMQEYLSSRKISLSPAELSDPVWQAKIACAQAFNNCPAYKGRERLLDNLATKYNKSKLQIRRWIDDVDKLRARTVHRITLGEERVELPESSSFTPEALACGLLAYANDMKAGMRAAYEKIRAQSVKIPGGQDNAWKIGEYVSFTRLVKKIPPSIWLRISRGATGFELHGLPKIIRQWTAVPVQSVICGDQKIFDYATYAPETDSIIKPEGYFWMDCSSRMITGVWIELNHYNQLTVGNSLREALRYGVPDEIFTDWGKPEGSKHITKIRQGLAGYSNTDDFAAMAEKYGDIPIDEGVEHRKAQPGKPWGKPIENIMNIFDIRLRAKNLPGYRKRNTEDPWANKEQQELLKKQAKHGGLMRIQDFITVVFDVVDEHNRAEKQLKEGGKIVPFDFFLDGLRKQPRTKFDDRTLDYICLPTFERKPRQSLVNVTVRANDHRSYYSPALSGRKDAVRICVDPYDRQAPASLIDASGEFIDIAEPWHVQHPDDRDSLAIKRAHQARIMKWVNEQARRVREGFDLYKPEATAREVIKITGATATAKEIEKEQKVYQLKKFEEKQEADRYKVMATEEQRKLEQQFSLHGTQDIDPWSLPDGRDKFAYYMKIQGCLELNKPLTNMEADFYARYPQTGDYRMCKDLFEDYGEIYLAGGTI